MHLNNRNAYYALIHQGVAARTVAEAGASLSRMVLDTCYRQWLEERTGQRSCKGLTYAQLQQLLDELKAGGWIKDRSNYRPGGGDSNRPTDQQWRKLAALTKVMQWQGGLDAHELQSFVQRTTGLAGTRFLTKPTISNVITGLEKWAYGGRHGNPTA